MKRYLYYAFVIFTLMFLLLWSLPGVVLPGGIEFYVVESGSMAPTLQVGDLIFVRPKKQYQKGDVVTYEKIATKKEETITHRVFRIDQIEGKKYFVTKGDANQAADKLPILEEEIKGKVIFKISGLGSTVQFLRNNRVVNFLMICASLAILFYEAYKIWNELKQKHPSASRDVLNES
jgi:signal peptidase